MTLRAGSTLPSFATLCVALLATGLSAALAFQAQKDPGLPNFDSRQGGADRAARQDPAHRTAAAQLRARLPEVQVDLDDITGSPKRVTARRGFVTGPKGEGGGVSTNAAREFAPAYPHRATKAFLKEHRALFGHGPEALATAKIKREFITAHNEIG